MLCTAWLCRLVYDFSGYILIGPYSDFLFPCKETWGFNQFFYTNNTLYSVWQLCIQKGSSSFVCVCVCVCVYVCVFACACACVCVCVCVRVTAMYTKRKLLFFFLLFFFSYTCWIITPGNRGYQENIFIISPWKHMLWEYGYSVEGLIEGLLMSTHNICFCGEIGKVSTIFGWN